MAPYHLADVRASRTIRRTMLRRSQLSCIAKGGCWFPVGVRASFFAKDLQALAPCGLVPLDRLGQLGGNMRPLRDWPFKCSVCAVARIKKPAVFLARARDGVLPKGVR